MFAGRDLHDTALAQHLILATVGSAVNDLDRDLINLCNIG